MYKEEKYVYVVTAGNTLDNSGTIRSSFENEEDAKLENKIMALCYKYHGIERVLLRPDCDGGILLTVYGRVTISGKVIDIHFSTSYPSDNGEPEIKEDDEFKGKYMKFSMVFPYNPRTTTPEEFKQTMIEKIEFGFRTAYIS